MADFKLINFYKFKELCELEVLAEEMRIRAKELSLLGTVLLAEEGINCGMYGSTDEVDLFVKYCEDLFGEVDIKSFTGIKTRPYRKLQVKIKKELVSFGVPVSYEESKRRYIPPTRVDSFIKEKDAIILDVRNDYEVRLGKLEGAEILPIHNFRDFPEAMRKFSPDKSRPILAYCTGGIRCEKAIPVLVEMGYDAYHIEGGIFRYLEQNPKNKFEGECYVFDERVSIDLSLEQGAYETCRDCGDPKKGGVCTSDTCKSKIAQ